ncbi:MAG: helix-turn-helix domain-containing protein [Asticcacaulis sp.]|uniref:helix-turn-helix domain-containing protein n=1 Tax=Asticcacaulis sp. TaxID=1872648 RepID=UPI003F7C6C84
MHVEGLVGWNLKRVREMLGVSQKELALRLLTIDQGYLSQLENGERNPTCRTIYRIAEALEISAGELFQTYGVPNEIAAAPTKRVPKSRAGRAPSKRKKPDKSK